ncbi:MAG TPA: ABC transporter permease subunit [Verrucomicrobiae bacterium]|nr:ABC transporter permease subunit [Verrucomicrobiae bacterium]
MSATTAIGTAPRPVLWGWPLFWLAMLVATVILVAFREQLQLLFPQLYDYPRAWIIPLANWTTIFMRDVVIEYFFTITRAISELLSLPLQVSYGLFDKGFAFGNGEAAVTVPPLSWVGVVATVAIIGHAYGGWRLALIGGLGFLYLAVFGQWSSSMRTMAMIVIAVPLGVIIGLLVGILGYRQPRFNKAVIVPLLDIAQAMPQYAYLVPILMLFGNNPVSAMIATLAFAVPPMVRVTTLALGQVPAEIKDFGNMAGCTRRQHLWRILVPSARPTLMVGVNQVINMTLNMVIIASMIGAGGLGFDVLLALRALKIGPALEAGIAIVVLAIVFDRISQAAATQPPAMMVPGQSFWRRHPHVALALGLLLLTTLLSLIIPELRVLPRDVTISTGGIWQAAITWINVNFFDYIEAGRVWLLLNILRPVKDFLLALPWIFVVAVLGAAGYQLGRWRLALGVMLTTMFFAVTGLWDITMTTVYLVVVSSVIAAMIGIPLGIWAARNDRADRILAVVVDTLQTIPAFCYLIPAVMLLRVGDVAAMLGIVLYAVAPAIRYTRHGIRLVSPHLIEAGKTSGCTRWQLLWRIQLPLALPEIMLGVNQVVFLALSMDIIAAMVGTSDLGQEVFKALSKVDAGRGLMGGLAVAFIGIIADRLISAWSQRVKERYGLA